MRKFNDNARSNINNIAVAAAATTFLFWVALAIFERHEMKEKTSYLHFYFHDIVSGKNVTAVEVASSPTTGSSFTEFGLVRVMDDWLTEGPEPTSKMLGKAQGIYVSSCQEKVHLLMTLTFVFDSGMYNGSTLAVVGKNAVFDEVREMPIVGGSGFFRFARGYALARTHSLDLTTGNAIVEYSVTVLHY